MKKTHQKTTQKSSVVISYNFSCIYVLLHVKKSKFIWKKKYFNGCTTTVILYSTHHAHAHTVGEFALFREYQFYYEQMSATWCTGALYVHATGILVELARG